MVVFTDGGTAGYHCRTIFSGENFLFFKLTGGKPGSVGVNLLMRKDGRIINLGSKTTVAVNAGVNKSYLFSFSVLSVRLIKIELF